MLETTKYLKSLRVLKGFDLCKMQEVMPYHRVTYKKYENNPLKVDINILMSMVYVLDGDYDTLFNALKQDYMSQRQIKKD